MTKRKTITLQVYSLCQGDLQSQLQVLKWYNDSIAASIRSNSGRRNSVPIRSLQGLYAIGNGVKHKDFALHGSQEMALFTHNTSTSALISIHYSSIFSIILVSISITIYQSAWYTTYIIIQHKRYISVTLHVAYISVTLHAAYIQLSTQHIYQ